MQGFNDIPKGWKLSYQEVSNNVYEVQLISETGLTVETTGDDLDNLIKQCVESADEIDQQLLKFT